MNLMEGPFFFEAGSPCVRIVVAWPKNLYKRENLGAQEEQPCDIHQNVKKPCCEK
jgi:hypothetical protein